MTDTKIETKKGYEDYFKRIALRAFGDERLSTLHRVPHLDSAQVESQGGVMRLRTGERLALNPYLVVIAIFQNEEELRAYCVPSSAPPDKVPEGVEKDPPPSRFTFPKTGRVVAREMFANGDLFEAELADEYIELESSTADFMNSPLEQAFEALAAKAGIDRDALYQLTCAELAGKFSEMDEDDDDEEEEESPESGPQPSPTQASS